MTQVTDKDTILSRQLRQLVGAGITEIVITTGPFDKILIEYCESLNLPVQFTFINNPDYAKTNYIYSLYLARNHLKSDILLLHGDMVFEDIVLRNLLQCPNSCMVVSSSLELPEKDFKAVILNDHITGIGVNFFENAVAAQPIYKLNKKDWIIWLKKICEYCENGNTDCYAEDALNEVSDRCIIYPFDVKNHLCNEIDTIDDLVMVRENLVVSEEKTVYMCFSTDVIHGGHINIIQKAAGLGRLTIGLLTDEVIASYKHFPILPFNERKNILENINGVDRVIPQTTLSYAENIRSLKPDYVVHGDDWITSIQRPIRDETILELNKYEGKLIEFPYSKNQTYTLLEQNVKSKLAIPDKRRGNLRRLLGLKKTISIIEAHSGITGLLAETTTIVQDGKAYQFDGMWISSLCDSTNKGKPDIELVDISSRLKTIDEIMEVTTKPIIFDGDTGGLIDHFIYNIKTLERIGVSAIIIEDKTGLKKNSLYGTEVEQTQDSIENFCAKISAGKRNLKTKDFMLIARIESLILEKGMNDALNRAFAYVDAGADGIMIHSRKKDPAEVFEFCKAFRAEDKITPLVVVPTTYNTVTEEEFASHGINIIIYANQLTRSSIGAMEKVAKIILTNRCSSEADNLCISINEILNLIPPCIPDENQNKE